MCNKLRHCTNRYRDCGHTPLPKTFLFTVELFRKRKTIDQDQSMMIKSMLKHLSFQNNLFNIFNDYNSSLLAIQIFIQSFLYPNILSHAV